MPLPISVLTGFPSSGKATILNHLIQPPGMLHRLLFGSLERFVEDEAR